MTAERFHVRIDPLWQPLLLTAGASRANAYVDVDGDTLDVQFGWLFSHTLRRSDVSEAVLRQWPVWMGVGWRTNFFDQIGLIGSYRSVVELRLHTPIRVFNLLRCRRLAISLEQPGRFLEALAEADRPLGF